MSKRPQPDSNSAEIAGWKQHAAHFGENAGDDAGSDEVIALHTTATRWQQCIATRRF